MLPAHAGMILSIILPSCFLIDVTRTRGDDPTQNLTETGAEECYPHTRGWSLDDSIREIKDEMLPAHAGMILIDFSREKRGTDVTRTRGDDPIKKLDQ